MAENHAKNPIQTTKSSFLLLQFIADSGGATLAELNDLADLSKGAIYNHLATLQEIGVIVRRDEVYYISSRIFRFSEAARTAYPGSDSARKKIWDLANATGEFAALVIQENETAIVIDIAAGKLTESIWLSFGQKLPLHSTAAGKVILSRMSEEKAWEVCSQADDEINTGILTEEIKTVEAQGIAFSRGEFREGQYSVAAPVVNSDNKLSYIVTLTGPENRLGGKALQQDVAGMVINTANELQKDFYSGV